MTDALAIQLEELVQRAAAFSDPNAMQGDIGAAMGELWSQAESANDQTALATISAAWERVQALAVQSAEQQALISGAAVMAQTALTQRDDALGELHTLVSDLDGFNTDNPKIERIYESGYQDAEEGLMDQIGYNGGFLTFDASETVYEGLLQAPGISEADLPDAADCGAFMHILLDASALKEAEARELIAFIKDFTQRVDARQEESRKEYEAYWKAQREAKAS